MSNQLIVESKNDEVFFRALVKHLNLKNIEIGAPICRIDDYDCLEGLNLKNLITRLKVLKSEIPKKGLRKAGIVLDHDGKRQERMNQINEAIQTVFQTDRRFTSVSEFIPVKARSGAIDYELNMACFLTHIKERGELETVLKAIKTKPSPCADCLEQWRDCLNEEGEIVSDKEFDKFWVANYLRFDTCSKKEKNQAGKYCAMSAFEYVLENKKDIFNFDHSALDSFKEFLNLFAQ